MSNTQSNVQFYNAIHRIPQSTPPIWFMRQAGRYHKHYQNLKKHHSFMELCKVPKLAAETALGPIDDFDFDVAILFSDLLFPLEALGMGLVYDPGPKLSWLLNNETIAKFKDPAKCIDQMFFQKEALQETRKLLPSNKSLIGFVGGPWTLFAYAVQGSHAGNLTETKVELSLFKDFCKIILPFLEMNIQLQLDGGAEVVMIMDTAVGELDPLNYEKYVLPSLKILASKFSKKIGYYTKGTTQAHLDVIKNLPWGGIGLDHRWNLAEAIKKNSQYFVQGNFDQSLLFLPAKEFEAALLLYLETIKKLTPIERTGWVCGVGHGILQHTPEANVKAFVQITREVFR